jgi:TfoX/Sxy family transcriptional regulator of competence genes
MKITYYTVPAEVLEDEDEVVRWARKAVAAALANESAKEVAKTLAKKPRKTVGKALAKKAR